MHTHATIRSYVAGFLLSVVLTFAAYSLVEMHILSGHTWGSHAAIISCIVAFGVVQLLVQLYFFLHLGKKSTPRSQTVVFAFMLFTLFVLVGGSLWIMYNLTYNMSPDFDVGAYMQSQDSL